MHTLQFKRILAILLGFNILTLILYLFPPVISQNSNRLLVILYLLTAFFLIWRGLSAGYNKEKINSKSLPFFYASTRFLNFLIVFYSLTFLFRYGYLMGCSPLDINEMITRLAVGFYNPDLGYEMARKSVGTSPIPWSLHFLFSIVNQLFFTVCFCEWEKLVNKQRFIVLIFSVLELFYWIGTGTAFGVITIISTILFTYILNDSPQNRFAYNRSVRKFRIFALVGFSAAIIFFSYNIIGRTGKGDSYETMKTILATNRIDENNIVIKSLPDEMISYYYYIYSYTCQGYEALGCAMDCDLQWTRFMGNNPNLMSLSSVLFGYNPMEDSYMMELERKKNIDSHASWHSQYLWWANDFTIIGALFIVFLIAFFCGHSLKLATHRSDFLSKIVCVVNCNMLLFLFANNTFLTSIFYSFMFLFPYWLYTRIIR